MPLKFPQTVEEPYFFGHEHAYSINTEQPYAVICTGHPRDNVTVFVEGGKVRCETFINATGQTITNILAGVGKPNAGPR